MTLNLPYNVNRNYATFGNANVRPPVHQMGNNNYNTASIWNTGATNFNGTNANSNDSKLTGGEILSSVGKGVLNSLTSSIKSLFTPGGLLKAAFFVGVAALTGPVGVAVMTGFGLAGGAITMAEGVMSSFEANTKEEAMAAWENVGAGAFQVAVNAVPFCKACKAIKGTTGVIGTDGKPIENPTFKQKAMSCFKESAAGKAWKTFKNGWKSGVENANQASASSAVETVKPASEPTPADATKTNSTTNVDEPASGSSGDGTGGGGQGIKERVSGSFNKTRNVFKHPIKGFKGGINSVGDKLGSIKFSEVAKSSWKNITPECGRVARINTFGALTNYAVSDDAAILRQQEQQKEILQRYGYYM